MMAVCVIEGKAAVTSGESGKTEGRRAAGRIPPPILIVQSGCQSEFVLEEIFNSAELGKTRSRQWAVFRRQ